MALVSTRVRVVLQSPRNDYLDSLCPQSELCLPPASPGSTGSYGPGSFQFAASALDPKGCEILCAFNEWSHFSLALWVF